MVGVQDMTRDESTFSHLTNKDGGHISYGDNDKEIVCRNSLPSKIHNVLLVDRLSIIY